MTHRLPSLLPRLILSVALLLPAITRAQALLYNGGGILMVKPGATLTVSGDYQHAPGAVLYTEGTMQVTGSVTGSAGSDIDINIGTLEVGGDFTHEGYLYSTRTGRLVMNGRTNQNLTLPSGARDTLGGLVVDKPVPGADTLRITGAVRIKGNFDLRSGMVRTAPNRAILLETKTATVTGERSGRYVQGTLLSLRYSASGNQPIDMQNGVTINPSGQNLGLFFVARTAGMRQRSVSYIDNPANPADRSIDQVWFIIVGNGATTPVPLTLSWLSDNDNGIPAADFARATAWNSLQYPARWLPVAPYQDATSRAITVLTTDLNRRWTVATAAAPLPVELVSFDATRNGTAARLTWATASEQNSAYFEVEVSPNGRDFRPLPASIGRIAAQGITTTPHTYATSDPALLTYSTDPVYYRLRQVDTDGTATFSEVKALHIGSTLPGKLAATLWPNPSGMATGAQLHVTLPTAAPLTVSLFDAVGRLIQSQTITPTAPGAQTVAVPGAEAETALAAGVYTVQVRQGAETVVQRLLR